MGTLAAIVLSAAVGLFPIGDGPEVKEMNLQVGDRIYIQKYGGVDLKQKVGDERFEAIVGTRAAWRRRGLANALMDVVHDWSAEAGDLIQAITRRAME